MTRPARPDPAFFDVTFVFVPRDAAGPEPWQVLAAPETDPFLVTVLAALRGEAAFCGQVTQPAEARPDALLFIDSADWFDRGPAIRAALPPGVQARVLLYFEKDPSGFWDFARALGPALPRVIAGGLDPAALGALDGYLQSWLAARTAAGRLLPGARFAMRDFAPEVAANAAKVAAVMARLADDESRADYARILWGTPEQVLAAFAHKAFGPQQYMDVVTLQPGQAVVNCGVGSGWELPYFLARIGATGSVFNLDPSIGYRLNRIGSALHQRFGGIIRDHALFLGERDGEATAIVGNDTMFQLAPPGTPGASSIPMRSIDSLVRDGTLEPFHYLKMDVEGAECAILAGALDSIARFRPAIAVAIYHEPSHFWDWPLFLMDRLDGYRWYIRQYGYSRFETLLYAVPEEAAHSRSGAEVPHCAALPPGPGAPEVRLHLQDLEPRTDYRGRATRPLTRVAGAAWATATIAPAAEILAGQVAAVLEGGELPLVMLDNTERKIVIGPAGGILAPAWEVEAGMDATRFVPAFGFAPLEGQFVQHDPVRGELLLAAWNGTRMVHRRLGPSAATPAAVWQVAGQVLLLRPTEAGLQLEGIGGAVPPRVIPLPAPLDVVTAASRFREGRREWGLALVARPDAGEPAAIRVIFPGEAPLDLGTWPIAGFRAVPTTFPGAALPG